jgi:hypothetical protein
MTDGVWCIVAELMDEVREPWAHFLLGWVCAHAEKEGMIPDRQLLVAISKSSGLIGAERLYTRWKELQPQQVANG